MLLQDEALSLKYLNMAASKPHQSPEAMYRLGRFAIFGVKDSPKGFHFFCFSFEFGFTFLFTYLFLLNFEKIPNFFSFSSRTKTVCKRGNKMV
jgi:hypothetical protein